MKNRHELMDDSSVFEEADEVGIQNIVEFEQDENTPLMTDPGWHDFIMAKFTPGEVIENNGERMPNCYGLRRVADIYLGTILESKPTNVTTSQSHTTKTPSIIVQYEITYRDFEGNIKTIGDVAEVNEENCDDLFMFYPVATACTRAEGRVLRKALKLKCLAAEEVTRKNLKVAAKELRTTEPVTGEAPKIISDKQMNLIQSRCDAMNIDIIKFINLESNKKYVNLDQAMEKRSGLSMNEASNLIKLLTGNYKVNPNTIPKEIVR